MEFDISLLILVIPRLLARPRKCKLDERDLYGLDLWALSSLTSSDVWAEQLRSGVPA